MGSLDLGIFSDKLRFALNAVDEDKKNLVSADGLLSSIREGISQESFDIVIKKSAECRMLLSRCMQVLDKISIIASNELRDSVIGGYQPRETMLGGQNRKDITKSNSAEDLVDRVLSGEIKSGYDIAKALGTKAKNTA
jgi:hypothetical protein